MTFAAQIAMCVVLVLAGLTVAVTGWRALRGTLPRNRFFGVRTPATLRDDEAFVVGNRVAAMPTLVGGVIWVVVGALQLAVPGTTGFVVLLVGILGSTVLITIGGVLGHRAAATLPEPESAGGCGGCPGGCCGG